MNRLRLSATVETLASSDGGIDTQDHMDPGGYDWDRRVPLDSGAPDDGIVARVPGSRENKPQIGKGEEFSIIGDRARQLPVGFGNPGLLKVPGDFGKSGGAQRQFASADMKLVAAD